MNILFIIKDLTYYHLKIISTFESLGYKPIIFVTNFNNLLLQEFYRHTLNNLAHRKIYINSKTLSLHKNREYDIISIPLKNSGWFSDCFISFSAQTSNKNAIVSCNLYNGPNYDFEHKNIIITNDNIWHSYFTSLPISNVPKSINLRLWNNLGQPSKIYIKDLVVFSWSLKDIKPYAESAELIYTNIPSILEHFNINVFLESLEDLSSIKLMYGQESNNYNLLSLYESQNSLSNLIYCNLEEDISVKPHIEKLLLNNIIDWYNIVNIKKETKQWLRNLTCKFKNLKLKASITQNIGHSTGLLFDELSLDKKRHLLFLYKHFNCSICTQNLIPQQFTHDGTSSLYDILAKLIAINKKQKYENTISILILSKNNFKMCRKAIDSILKYSQGFNFEILIGLYPHNQKYIDFAKDYYNIKVVVFPEALNYSEGNNVLAEISTGKILIFMNDDVEVKFNWLERIILLFRQDNIGIIGNLLHYPDGTIQHAGIHIHDGSKVPVENFKHEKKQFNIPFLNVDVVTGALLAIKKVLFDEIGQFDTIFIWGYEDVDLNCRVKVNGYNILCNLSPALIHHEHATLNKQKTSYYVHNKYYFIRKWRYFNLAKSLNLEPYGVIITSYKKIDDLKINIEIWQNLIIPPEQILVIDNNSNCKIREELEAYNIKLIINPENDGNSQLGERKMINQGIEYFYNKNIPWAIKVAADTWLQDIPSFLLTMKKIQSNSYTVAAHTWWEDKHGAIPALWTTHIILNTIWSYEHSIIPNIKNPSLECGRPLEIDFGKNVKNNNFSKLLIDWPKTFFHAHNNNLKKEILAKIQQNIWRGNAVQHWLEQSSWQQYNLGFTGDREQIFGYEK